MADQKSITHACPPVQAPCYSALKAALAGLTLCTVIVGTSPNAHGQSTQIPTVRSGVTTDIGAATDQGNVNPSSQSLRSLSETAYTLGAGDRIQIDIFRVPQYSGESQVLIDGLLNLPLIGQISVKGMTLDEATSALTSQYSQYLRNPRITVTLLGRRPFEIGIAGEVNRPGSYAVNPEGSLFPRLTQLLERAGGITQAADVRQVQIQRLQRDGSRQLIDVSLWELLQTGDLSYDITLRDGDSIFIPTTTVALQDSALLADASFAPDRSRPINVAIIGEVYRPGPYTIQGSSARTRDAGETGAADGSSSPTTVTSAIQVAGGIKPQADIRRVQVVRSTRTGSPQLFEVDLWKLLESGDLQQDAILQEGDTVFIPTATELNPTEVPTIASASFSPNSIRVNVVGEVRQSGTLELQPNTPLSQAILAAGGFNNRANKGSAELIRLNPDGTVNRQTIPVDFAQGINEENNPLLRNNDVVIVNPSGVASFSDGVASFLDPIGRVLSNILLPIRFLNIFN